MSASTKIQITCATLLAAHVSAHGYMEDRNFQAYWLKKNEIYASSTEKSPASAILTQNMITGVDFGAWPFSFRRIVKVQVSKNRGAYFFELVTKFNQAGFLISRSKF